MRVRCSDKREGKRKGEEKRKRERGPKERRGEESASGFILARAFTDLLTFYWRNWLPAVDHQAATTIKNKRTNQVQRGNLLSSRWVFLSLETEMQGSRWRGIPGERQSLSSKGLKKLASLKEAEDIGKENVSLSKFLSFGSCRAPGPSCMQGRKTQKCYSSRD